MKSLGKIFLSVAMLLLSSATLAMPTQKIQNHAELKEKAKHFIESQFIGSSHHVKVEIGNIDPSLRLQSCDSLDAFLPRGRQIWGKTTVGLRCNAPAHWSIYLSTYVHIYGEYIVASHSLNRGDMVGNSDIRIKEGELTSLPLRILTRPQDAIGKILSRNIREGESLREDVLKAKKVIQQGKYIKLVTVGKGFRITSEGRAQNNASVGQMVNVKTKSGNMVTGIAKADGVVEITY